MRQTCLTRVVSWLSALCLRCWAVPQQCQQPLAVPLKGELGRARAALSYRKPPVAGKLSSVFTVPYLRWHLRWLRGEAVYMKATAGPCHQHPSPSAPSFVAPRPLSTWWEAAAHGARLPECHRELPTRILLQLAREAAGSGERCCWQLGLLAAAHGAYLDRLSIKRSPMPASLTCSCPFPADTGNCSAPVVLIQEYGAGLLGKLSPGFFPLIKEKTGKEKNPLGSPALGSTYRD